MTTPTGPDMNDGTAWPPPAPGTSVPFGPGQVPPAGWGGPAAPTPAGPAPLGWGAPTAAPVPAAPTPAAEQRADNGLGGLFDTDRGSHRMFELMRDPEVQDIRANSHDRIFYTDHRGSQMVDRVFPGPAQYEAFIDNLLKITDVGYTSVAEAQKRLSVIEGSFRRDRTEIKGSIIVATSNVTQGEPVLVIRKQPTELVTIDHMLDQGMLDLRMRNFLELAIRGRLNILVSGGSGAGKTTMARALSWFIDPNERVLTAEEIDELHLEQRLPNVTALTTYRDIDETGNVRREENLEDLVRHALRLRPDRVWVGETRGKEAYALVKACLSGHDGSVTTVHANNAAQAIRQLTSYVMESHLTEEVARDQIANAFHLAVQITKGKLGRRMVSEIVELEPVREGNNQRTNDLFRWNAKTGQWDMLSQPTPRLVEALERYNVNFADYLRSLGINPDNYS